MKKKFSTAWISSKQPRKQRKYKANAPLHTRHKFLSAHLSKILREKYGRRSFPIRKGDEVIVMRGSFKKKKAKIITVDLIKSRVTLEGIQRAKKDGTKVSVYFNPSALKIETLTLDDKKRISALDKTKKTEKKEPKAKEKKEEKKTSGKESITKEKKNAPNKSTSK